MATDVKARFATGGTATSATTLAAEQDASDGAALTLTGAAATFAQGDDGSCTVQRITLTSGSGDDNSAVTYTVIGTDHNGSSITEDITGGAGGATVTSTLFYNTVTSITGNGGATTDITAGVTSVGMHAVFFAGRTRVKGMHGVIGSADNFLFKTTSSTGATVMTIPADAGDLDPYIPDDGVLFTSGCFLPMDQGDVTGLTVYLDA
jgi:hypothetical protein|tara:strand:- start:4296 stop:4913 length:618 start_codon:yes stop_codon:yes gene_type:complete